MGGLTAEGAQIIAPMALPDTATASVDASGVQSRQSADILHLATAIPPVVCGVGDYAFQVNRTLGQNWGLNPRLHAPRPSEPTSGKVTNLKDALRSARIVILQYSGYAYQRYGAPLWLARTLSEWKAAASSRRLVTTFHELYAMGKPWSTAFWTSASQRYVVRELVRISDAVMTTTLRQAAILRSWNSRIEIAILPVPSNVGELPEDQVARPRENMLVAFGQFGTRERLYLNNAHGWALVRKSMPRAVIHDVGSPTGLPIAELTGLRCEAHGELPPSRISELFQAARFGVLDYNRSTLDKSGVFASYCAHGIVPIVFRHATPPSSALLEREHFLTPSSAQPCDAETSGISRNAHGWYSRHNLAEHARTTYRLLGPEI